jgi:YjbE family integral membrane protein
MTSFLARAGAIVLIDLLLAGDNAVVIAMAVRGLPPQRRRTGIALGALAAVAIRVVLTFFVSQLLAMRYVRLVGGGLILWIALKLFVDGEGPEGEGPSVTSVADAVKVIVVADVTMSLDNMLAVGGASRGDLSLLAFGLALSIPLIVFTSDLLARLMARFPVVVYVGAAVLGKVAAEMIFTDPATRTLVHPSPSFTLAAEAVFAAGIVGAGALRGRRGGSARGVVPPPGGAG